MEAKLEAADQGDMMDFKMDGGMAFQQFDGVDYAGYRKNKKGGVGDGLMFIDTGKRERKQRLTQPSGYGDEAGGAGAAGSAATAPPLYRKLPKSLRLPKMDDWQFYDRARLAEISRVEAVEYVVLLRCSCCFCSSVLPPTPPRSKVRPRVQAPDWRPHQGRGGQA